MAGGGKTVCRFFREGRCRFGANCRNYHPTGNVEATDRGWGQSGNSRGGGQSNPHSNDSNRGWGAKQGGNRFQLFSERSDDGGRGGRSQSRDNGPRRNPFDRLGQKSNDGQDQWNNTERRQDNWSRGGQSNQGRQQQDRWGGGQGRQQQDRWGGGGQDRQQQDRWRGGQDRQQQDRWRGGGQGRQQQDRWGGGGGQWNSRDDRRNSQQGNDQPTSPKDIAECIRVDMEEWGASKMWPLSCYAYAKETPCIPGLVDVSTDELRWEAYHANALGNSAKYLQSLIELGEKQMRTQRQFSTITADDIGSMQSNSGALFGGADGGSSGGLFGAAASPTTNPSLFTDTSTNKTPVFGPSLSGPTVSSMFGGQSQSLFSTANTGMVSAAQSAPLVSVFQQMNSQTVPIANSVSTPIIQSVGPTTQAPGGTSTANSGASSLEDIINSTKARELNKTELEAYSTDKFILGNLPEHAPLIV